MNILAFDISKKSTGVCQLVDGKIELLRTVSFENSVQWEDTIGGVIQACAPDVIVFSETINRMCSMLTIKVLSGLMYHLQHIGFREGISVIPFVEQSTKKYAGIKGRKTVDIKKNTVSWAKETFKLPEIGEDEADALCFAYYAENNLVEK